MSQNDRKGKNAEQMLHDANDAKELSDDLARTKDLCYDYNQLCPSDEEGKQNNQTTTSDFPCNFNFTVSNMNRFNQGIDHG